MDKNELKLAALELAKKGFPVFPLQAGSKLPACSWKEWATTDPKKIEDHWSKHPFHNIGIHCKDLLVLDIDSKNNGQDSLKSLIQTHGPLPKTLRQKTPSGGFHILYRLGDSYVSNSASKIAPGIDIRTTGGYIVAAPSRLTNQEKPYKWVEADSELARVPEWCVNLTRISEIASKLTNEAVELEGPALDAAIKRAKSLLSTYPPAIQGQGGNAHTFALAAKLRDLGLPQDQALDLLISEWNDTCVPPWHPEELKFISLNAYRYAKNPLGIDAPEADFQSLTPIEPNKMADEPTKKWGFTLYEDIKPSLDDRYIIDGVIPHNSMVCVFGPPKSMKTAEAVRASLCVAFGWKWCGMDVEQGPVLYLALEGQGAIKDRIEAHKIHYNQKGKKAPFLLDSTPLFAEAFKPEDLSTYFKSLPIGHPKLIVVDTLSRAMAGNENSQEDMNRFVNRIDWIRRHTGAAILVIHHTGHNEERYRGSSVLGGAVDVMIKASQKGWQIQMSRMTEPGRVFKSFPKSVVIGQNAKGRPVESFTMTEEEPGTEIPAFEKSDPSFEISEPLVGNTRAHRAVLVLKNHLDTEKSRSADVDFVMDLVRAELYSAKPPRNWSRIKSDLVAEMRALGVVVKGHRFFYEHES